MLSTIVLIVWTAIRIEIAIRLWNISVLLAHFPYPIKPLSIVLLVIDLLLWIWSINDSRKIFYRLGIKKVALIVLAWFLFFIILNTTLTTRTPSLIKRLNIGAVVTAARLRRVVSETLTTVITAPDEFLFAYTGTTRKGSRKLQIPPGFPTPDPSKPPIIVVVQPATPGPESTELKSGGYARIKVNGRDKAVTRSLPQPSAMVTARFADNQRVLILDGPKRESRLEGDPSQWNVYEWWKIHGSSGEGWIVDTWLIPSN